MVSKSDSMKTMSLNIDKVLQGSSRENNPDDAIMKSSGLFRLKSGDYKFITDSLHYKLWAWSLKITYIFLGPYKTSVLFWDNQKVSFKWETQLPGQHEYNSETEPSVNIPASLHNGASVVETDSFAMLTFVDHSQGECRIQFNSPFQELTHNQKLE